MSEERNVIEDLRSRVGEGAGEEASHRENAPDERTAQEAPQRKMTRAEAGRKGGLRTKERHGEDYFGRIGRMGGKKGGEATKQRYGVEFYRSIGRKGGSR
ncbi:MAG TPA: hypothetical protein VGB64_06500 [Actinomycetota bacterium]